jgi:GH25 family lysozyme M1 (1,4-beta-N-acetylmuramidase)
MCATTWKFLRLIVLFSAALSLLCGVAVAGDLNDDGYMGFRYPLPCGVPPPLSGWDTTSHRSTVLHGVDVSYAQGTIDWDTLQAAVDFAIIRSSKGCPDPGQTVAQYTDSYLSRNQSEARRVGILHGYYHYAYPQYNDPEPEADQFLNAIGSLQNHEMLCLDYEESSDKDPVDWCARFLERVYARTGLRPLLYINYAMASSHNWSRVINDTDDLWEAHWDGSDNPKADSTPWPFVAMKQYSNSGGVGGVTGNVDLDVFNGGISQFQAYGHPIIITVPEPTSAGTITREVHDSYVSLTAHPNPGYAVGDWYFDNALQPNDSGKATITLPLFGASHIVTHAFAVVPAPSGDLNHDGKVNETDADLVLQYLAGERNELDAAVKALATSEGLSANPADVSTALWILQHQS